MATNILHQYVYAYDASGNRTGEQVDTNATGANYNVVNELTNQISNGMVQFAGNLSKTGVVSVAGGTAVITNQTNFSAYVTTQNGTNQVQISATDLDLNTGVTNYQLVVTNNGVARTLTYDLNGNLTTNATSTGTNTFEWDAENRLTAVNEAGTNRSEFSYDGIGRRVQIVEKTNGFVATTKRFVWCGNELCEERDSTGTNVTKRFFAQGEQIITLYPLFLTNNYYFTRDHLGSVREMLDSGGTIHARYDYDPYGRRTKVSGDLDADFGFTGDYYHPTSALCLTLYRAYDPNTGRWISRDPMGEELTLNLYAYVENDPPNLSDILGLKQYTAMQTYQILANAYASATAGPEQGLQNIYNNSSGAGPYDFGYLPNNLAPGPNNDTFVVNGVTMTADQFGNFIAGFQGAAYDHEYGGSIAITAVKGAGFAYHNIPGQSKSKNDPCDKTGMPYINAGAAAAPGFIGSPVPGSPPATGKH